VLMDEPAVRLRASKYDTSYNFSRIFPSFFLLNHCTAWKENSDTHLFFLLFIF
jgi:hypothetical protein